MVDFVVAGSSFTFGFGVLRKGGRLVSVGLLGGAASLVPAMVALKAVSVIGSYVGSLADMQELMAMARTGALPDMPITRMPLTDASQALDALRAGHVRGRIVLQPPAADR